MSISDLYSDTATLKRMSHTSDDYGGNTVTWETSIASYDCRIYKKSVNDEYEIAIHGRVEKANFICIGGVADIVIGDKLIDGSDEYLVLDVYRVTGKSSEHHLEMKLKKL